MIVCNVGPRASKPAWLQWLRWSGSSYSEQGLASGSELACCSDGDVCGDSKSSPAVATAMAVATARAFRPGCSNGDGKADVERAIKKWTASELWPWHSESASTDNGEQLDWSQAVTKKNWNTVVNAGNSLGNKIPPRMLPIVIQVQKQYIHVLIFKNMFLFLSLSHLIVIVCHTNSKYSRQSNCLQWRCEN